MTTNLSERLQRLSPSATLAMSQRSSELKAEGVDVINMSVGEPDFNTPDHIKAAAIKAVEDNYSRYSPVPGYPELKKAIVAKLKNENGLDYAPSQILVSNGAKQSVCNTIMAVVNAGDEVIIPAPYWVSYPQMVLLAEGTPVFVEATIEHATDGTCFYFAGNSSNSGNHGFCVDDILVTRLSAADSRKGNLRLLYWNIQNGMWADQPNNYDNFVAWVKKYDPDICVWCESASIYKDRTGTSAPTADRFLPNGWPGLAARYGHQHSAVGGWRDNYPQTVTSKYPVTSILKITNTDVNNKPIAHGAAIQEVNVNGRKLWFVTAHMWPQGYGYGVSSANQEASKAKHEGDYYREYEMNYIVAHTINDSKYAAQQDWFLLGDFNSRSRRDNWFYNYAADDTALLTQDVVLNKTDMVDVIAQSHPGQFITSTMGSARIDFVYASPSMYAKVVDAMVLMDKWTSSVKSTWYPSFYDPSDHRPILIDLEIN